VHLLCVCVWAMMQSPLGLHILTQKHTQMWLRLWSGHPSCFPRFKGSSPFICRCWFDRYAASACAPAPAFYHLHLCFCLQRVIHVLLLLADRCIYTYIYVAVVLSTSRLYIYIYIHVIPLSLSVYLCLLICFSIARALERHLYLMSE
jgi:hypothetical protein